MPNQPLKKIAPALVARPLPPIDSLASPGSFAWEILRRRRSYRPAKPAISEICREAIARHVELVDCIGERLPLANTGAKALATALATFANAADDTPHVITLSEQPFLPMLAIAAPQATGTGLLGFLRFARKGNARPPVFASLTGLPPSEARLAIAMIQQPTLADAAASLGITIETARNYSKRIYAQTNTRGQPDLVRLILNGLAALA